MTRAVRRVLPETSHPAAVALPVLLAIAAAGALAIGGHGWAASGVVLAAGVAGGLALHVDLPWGGRLTLGHALLISIVARVEPRWAIVIAVGGTVLALPSWLVHQSEGPIAVRLGGAVSVLAASATGLATRLALEVVVPDATERDLRTAVFAGVVGVVFLATDHVIRSAVAARVGERSELTHTWPLHITLLCVAVLIDLAAGRSVMLALVAVVPLLVTRYSFQRSAEAQVTYEQTARALSLLPEVAGLTPLGHSERTAAYVEALCLAMGFDIATIARLTNAARLHDIGHISLHEVAERHADPDPSMLGDVSAEILRDTGFLDDLVDLVRDCQPGGPPASSIDAAIIRVCSTLDDLVEAEGDIDPFAKLVVLHPLGHERTVAIELLALSHRQPGLVAEARAGVELIHQVAAGAHSH